MEVVFSGQLWFAKTFECCVCWCLHEMLEGGETGFDRWGCLTYKKVEGYRVPRVFPVYPADSRTKKDDRMTRKWWFEMVELVYDLLVEMANGESMSMELFFRLDRLLEVFGYKERVHAKALKLFKNEGHGYEPPSAGMRLRSRQL
jgi:hypothetical protein